MQPLVINNAVHPLKVDDHAVLIEDVPSMLLSRTGTCACGQPQQIQHVGWLTAGPHSSAGTQDVLSEWPAHQLLILQMLA